MSATALTPLALSAEQARAARNYFGWSQAALAQHSGLSLQKLKRFEAGSGKSGTYIPDTEFLQSLRDYFEDQGYTFDDTPAPGDNAKRAGQVFPAGVVGDEESANAPGAGNRHQKTSIHHMRIAIRDEDEMGRVLDLIEANEEKVESLLKKPIGPGVIDELNNKSELAHIEALKLLAENGTMWSRLFGREVGGTPDAKVLAGQAKPKTHADLLHRNQATAHRAVKGDKAAIAQRKQPTSLTSLADALFGIS